MRINIAIDGPSAAGKSTIAKTLAKKLGYIHLDTGAMYRCVALAAKNNKIGYKDYRRLYYLLKKIDVNFDSLGNVYLNNVNVSKEIRTSEISLAASDVSTIKCVRKDMVLRQQIFAANKGIIMDGRDIGTVVLPNAEVKIYLTASSMARAKRRYLEDEEKGLDSDFNQIVKDIENRDFQDINRKNSPLKQAKDAVYIDTSDLDFDQAAQAVLNVINEKFPEGVDR